MESTVSQVILDWCEQNGWTEPQLVNRDWWTIAPDSFVPVPVPRKEIWAMLSDSEYVIAAREVIDLLEASAEEAQEARDRWNQWIESEVKKQRHQRQEFKQQSKQKSRTKSQFLQGVEKLLKQGKR